MGLVGRPGRATAPASWPAATSTRCPTAARTTVRSASCRRSPRSTCCAPRGVVPARPVGVVNFTDEEGARFGIACAGSRLLTGVLDADRARALSDDDGTTLAEAMTRAGRRPAPPRPRTTRRCAGSGPSSSCTSSRAAASSTSGARRRREPHLAARPVAPRPARRGQPRRAPPGWSTGTTRCPTWPRGARGARAPPSEHGARGHDRPASRVEPDGTNAVPSLVQAWLDARAPDEQRSAPSSPRWPRAAGDRAAHRGVVDARVVDFDGRAARPARRARSAACPVLADRRRARRRHPGRRPACRSGDAVRAQPDRRLALPRRVRRAGRLPRRGRRARRPCWPTSP